MSYTTDRWGRLGIDPVRYSAELDTDRDIWAPNQEQFLREVRPVWGLVTHLSVQFRPQRADDVGTVLGTDIRILLTKYDMEGPLRVSIHVDGPNRVLEEGTADLLTAEVSEWAKAQTAILPKAAESQTIDDAVEPQVGSALKSTASTNSAPGVKLAGSISVGILVGLSAMSVYAYGWESGPSILLLTILGAVLAAIFVHRFGWNR